MVVFSVQCLPMFVQFAAFVTLLCSKGKIILESRQMGLYRHKNWKSHAGAISPSTSNSEYKLFVPLKQQELILSRPQRKTLNTIG